MYNICHTVEPELINFQTVLCNGVCAWIYPALASSCSLVQVTATDAEVQENTTRKEHESRKLNPQVWEKNPRPPSSLSTPRSPLQQLAEMMHYLQRAVVLAHRGGQWVLLQNACRALWNAVNSLVITLQGPRDVDSTCKEDSG